MLYGKQGIFLAGRFRGARHTIEETMVSHPVPLSLLPAPPAWHTEPGNEVSMYPCMQAAELAKPGSELYDLSTAKANVIASSATTT